MTIPSLEMWVRVIAKMIPKGEIVALVEKKLEGKSKIMHIKISWIKVARDTCDLSNHNNFNPHPHKYSILKIRI